VDERRLIKALQEAGSRMPRSTVLRRPPSHNIRCWAMENVTLTAHVRLASARFDEARSVGRYICRWSVRDVAFELRRPRRAREATSLRRWHRSAWTALEH